MSDLLTRLRKMAASSRVGGMTWDAELFEEAAGEIERLREALKFYADENAWNQPPVKVRAGLLGDEYENQASKVRWDRGRVARAALAPPLTEGQPGEP